jgi:hypothetical protein
MINILNKTLSFLGVIWLATLIHELYHFLTMKTATGMCLGTINGATFGVIGSSSEIIAYSITILIIIIGFSYIIFKK